MKVIPTFVSAESTRKVLSWKDMIARLRSAYSVTHGPLASPPRVVAREGKAWIRALAAVPPGSRYMGAKIFGFGQRASVSYLIALFEKETGALTALIDANLVTAYRTAATSSVAVDCIAPHAPVTMGVLGSGLEAQGHARAIATIRDVREVYVYSPNEKNREAFAEEFTKEVGKPCTAVRRPEDAVGKASIVVAAARSYDESPILRGEWLREGQIIVSIGSTLPDQREIDENVVEKCDLIVCDMPEEVIEQTGDMIAAKKAGVDFESKIISLNALLRDDNNRNRAKAARLPMFKSVGAAIQDIVVAEIALERALEAGLAEQSTLDFLIKQT